MAAHVVAVSSVVEIVVGPLVAVVVAMVVPAAVVEEELVGVGARAGHSDDTGGSVVLVGRWDIGPPSGYVAEHHYVSVDHIHCFETLGGQKQSAHAYLCLSVQIFVAGNDNAVVAAVGQPRVVFVVDVAVVGDRYRLD